MFGKILQHFGNTSLLRRLQALECNAQGRKVKSGKRKGRRTALYFRLIRPASGLHAHDMDGRGGCTMQANLSSMH